MKFLILGLLACFVAAAWADEGNDMYFEASGEGVTGANNPDSPFDDEDSDEASGSMPFDDGPVSTSFWETTSPTTSFHSTLPNVVVEQSVVYDEEGELFSDEIKKISVPPLQNVGDKVDPGDDEDTEVEIIDTDDEPEVTGTTEKPQETKGRGLGINRIVEPEEEPEKAVDENEINAAEQEGDAGDEAGAAAGGASTQFMAAVIVGGCIGLLFAICVIMLLVYRMRKKDEGSYALEYGLDSKKPQGNYDYTKGVDSKEYFA